MNKQDNNFHTIRNIDDLLSVENIFSWNYEKISLLRNQCILNRVRQLISENKYYKQYCKQKNITIEMMENYINYTPKLPSSIFKKHSRYVDENNRENTYLTTSSGTQGTLSKIPRDSVTMMRIYSSIFAGVLEILKLSKNFRLILLSPPNSEVDHLWIAYILSGVAIHYDSKHYISGGKFESEKFMKDIFVAAKDDRQTVILGTPALIVEIAKKLDQLEHKLNFNSRCVVLSAGGWKKRSGEKINDSDYRKLVVKAFGLNDESYVMDIFNMVELNSVIFECLKHKKHCPPWLYVRAFDPWTLKVCKSGEFGILGYLDPTANSFPGFVFSDDFGKVYEKVNCECGITSDVVVIERRINKLESRGCALKI
ncbi:MAG: hypothetical protein FWC41_00820 [Firmicutes bacterium]|nr:hypothetical protein [Bacillota bacterium]